MFEPIQSTDSYIVTYVYLLKKDLMIKYIPKAALKSR